MNDEDFLLIEAEIRQLSISIGAPELTEDRFYLRRSGVEDADLLLPPRQRVLEQLESLDRFLSIFDGAVYREAMSKIQTILQESPPRLGKRSEAPTGALVQFPDRTAGVAEPFDLGELPDLTNLRKEVRELRMQLAEA